MPPVLAASSFSRCTSRAGGIPICIWSDHVPSFFVKARHSYRRPDHRPAASRGARTTGGVVHGTVKDATGAVIPNAVVTLTDQNGKTQTANTQADGTYQFRGVAPGAYTVSADVKGFTQTGVVAVMAAVGTPAQGDITMKVENVKQEVTIAENTTTQVSVDPSQNASALVLKGEDLAALPDDPDDLAADLSDAGRNIRRESARRLIRFLQCEGAIFSKTKIIESRNEDKRVGRLKISREELHRNASDVAPVKRCRSLGVVIRRVSSTLGMVRQEVSSSGRNRHLLSARESLPEMSRRSRLSVWPTPTIPVVRG